MGKRMPCGKEVEMKKAVVTGAAGFAGCNLVEHLIRQGYEVYAVVRESSAHNRRLQESRCLHPIMLDMEQMNLLPGKIWEPCDLFYHLAWAGGRDEFDAQYRNVAVAVSAVEAAAQIGCRRFICTGSQAEYGSRTQIQTEDLAPQPFSSYGAAKAAACYLTQNRAQQLDIDWIWGRIFSLIGRYEPHGRMLPDLVQKIRAGETAHLSAGTQNWDYLDAGDAADELIALGERGRSGEISNIANGDYHPLKEFTEQIRTALNPEAQIIYGELPSPLVSLQPSMEKVSRETGWKPKVSFMESISEYQ